MLERSARWSGVFSPGNSAKKKSKNDCDYTLPGDGEGQVERILTDLLGSGYNGFISIEPHTAVVFHSAGEASHLDPAAKAREQYDSYVAYGRRMMEVLRRIPAA